MNGQLSGGVAPPQAPPSAPPGMPAPSGGGGGSRGPRILAIVAIVLVVALAAVLIAVLVGSPRESSTSSDGANNDGSAEQTSGAGQGQDDPGSGGDSAAGSGLDVSSGPITSPAGGDAVRAALMDAARRALEIESEFYVLQIYVQGDAALAELQPVGSSDIWGMAFRDQGGWEAVWIGYVGDQSALDELRDPDVALSEDLIDAADWTPAPTSYDAGQEMVRMLTEGTAFDADDFEADVVSLVKGTDGGWWAWGWVYPLTDPTLQSEQFFITRPKGSTQWEAVQVGTGVAITDLEGEAPPNVIEQFQACDT